MKMKRWEVALGLGMVICLVAGLLSTGTQAGLSDKMVRLHVLANSDSTEDQALKHEVRDRILLEIGPEDGRVTDALLKRLEAAAADQIARAGYDYGVSVTRQWMYFDTRVYDDFALPAGYYDAVRVLIGEGAGQNWWCVIFPPLCSGVCEAEVDDIAREAGLSEDEIGFIRGDGTTYVVRFKIAEVLGRLGRGRR